VYADEDALPFTLSVHPDAGTTGSTEFFETV
jgi:hypothetical protein